MVFYPEIDCFPFWLANFHAACLSDLRYPAAAFNRHDPQLILTFPPMFLNIYLHPQRYLISHPPISNLPFFSIFLRSSRNPPDGHASGSSTIFRDWGL